MFFAHFKTIRDNPLKFTIWVLTSIVLSLSSFWLPSIIGVIAEKDVYSALMKSVAFIPFCIVFLCNVLFSSISYTGLNSNDNATGVRTISFFIIIVFLIFLSSLLPLKHIAEIEISYKLQYFLLFSSIFIGLYAYGFREQQWEKSVDKKLQEEETNIIEISTQADKIESDGEVDL